MNSIKMAPVKVYSSVVKGALAEVELWVDELTKYGYFNDEQRDFLDKYLYKNEDALKAAEIITLDNTAVKAFRTSEIAHHQKDDDTNVATSSLVSFSPSTTVTNSQSSDTAIDSSSDGKASNELSGNCNAREDVKLGGVTAITVAMAATTTTCVDHPVKISRGIMPEYQGITAKFSREGRDIHFQRIIKFSSKILSTSEQKTTRHFPGLVIVATSAQQVGKGEWMRIVPGDRLEILCSRGGNDFDAYGFRQRVRGMVRIHVVEM